MKHQLLTILSVLIFVGATAQDMSIDETVTYINNKLRANPKIENSNFYHNHKYESRIEVTNDGYLIVNVVDYNRYSNQTSYEQCWQTGTKYLIKTTKVGGPIGYNGNCFKEGNITLEGIGIYDYGNCSLSLNYQGQAKSSAMGVIKFGNELEIGESLCNAINYLLNLCKVSLKEKSTNDPFAAKTTNFGGLDTEKNIVGEVRLKRMNGGTYQVPVILNGVLKIDFIFDSGASDVSISPDIALTLMKTGTVKQTDFIGTQKYSFADGSSATSKVFYLREVEIGGYRLKNVKASISNSLNAPMLLGQSVLQQLGSVTIDNERSVLIIRK
jgi:aspartyl protease family protein